LKYRSFARLQLDRGLGDLLSQYDEETLTLDPEPLSREECARAWRRTTASLDGQWPEGFVDLLDTMEQPTTLANVLAAVEPISRDGPATLLRLVLEMYLFPPHDGRVRRDQSRGGRRQPPGQ